MTTKRDKKQDEPKAAKRPKLKKETLKDLEAGDGQKVKGGAALRGCSYVNTGCNV